MYFNEMAQVRNLAIGTNENRDKNSDHCFFPSVFGMWEITMNIIEEIR